MKMSVTVFCALLMSAVAAHAAEKKDSGPTQAQIDCKKRAVHDYYDQLKECDKALSDLPADNAQCHSDARDDLGRRQSACTAAARVRAPLIQVRPGMAIGR